MLVCLLVAVSKNGVIGRNNELLWRLPNDLKRFKTLTMGYPMIMGRKTFESIGKPLPGRTSIVITRSTDYSAAGIRVGTSLSHALDIAREEGKENVFIVGGGEIYTQALEGGVVDKIYLTRICADAEGDTFFEIPDTSDWTIVNEEFHPADEKHPEGFIFVDLVANKTLQLQ
jgi:dihydrofolate reductase